MIWEVGMRYLTLAADYMDPVLTEVDGGAVSLGEAGLSRDLIDDIISWNADYQEIVRVVPGERRDRLSDIMRLDERGLELARRVASEASPARVRYYSEGLLKHLD
ncbi:hypothetical protein SAMN04489812_4025 [Microlunatus soli]|uniref:Uncharacterized protein n=1 Tax=Microlunatus soli TaxID=630515 RepID=A0A1H1XEC4_9ACTN|nr:hypothetical protein SAMN04489812_4025 [Microlunatus soli]